MPYVWGEGVQIQEPQDQSIFFLTAKFFLLLSLIDFEKQTQCNPPECLRWKGRMAGSVCCCSFHQQLVTTYSGISTMQNHLALSNPNTCIHCALCHSTAKSHVFKPSLRKAH